jgi:hypothetical protein
MLDTVARKAAVARQAPEDRYRQVELSMVLAVVPGRDPRRAAERFAVQ